MRKEGARRTVRRRRSGSRMRWSSRPTARTPIGDVDGCAIEIGPVQTQCGFEQFCIGLGTEAPELRLHGRRRAISDQNSQ